MFIKEYSERTETTLNFLSSIPEQMTILIVDELVWKAKVDGLITLPAHLVVIENTPVAHLQSQLQSVFANRPRERRPMSIF
jgi:7-keto-8-aminopelargonate synthetase-like enzyme